MKQPWGPSVLNFLSFPTTANSPPTLTSSASIPFSVPNNPNSTWSAFEAGPCIRSAQPLESAPLSGALFQTPDMVNVFEVISKSKSTTSAVRRVIPCAIHASSRAHAVFLRYETSDFKDGSRVWYWREAATPDSVARSGDAMKVSCKIASH